MRINKVMLYVLLGNKKVRKNKGSTGNIAVKRLPRRSYRMR